jgi:transposase
VVKVIQEEFGVAYSKSQVSRLLKALGWTSQVPITRAIHLKSSTFNNHDP